MRQIDRFFIAGLLLASVVLGGEKKGRLRLVHADLLKRNAVGQKTQQLLSGNVRFEQDSTRIECDVASQFLGEDQVSLIGSVHIYDDTQSLFADTVHVFQKESKQVAIGNVKSVTPNDTTTSDRMTYFQKKRKVVSVGHVRIVNPKERTVLTGGEAEYFRKDHYGKVFVEPMLIQFDSLGSEAMRILADTMEVFNRGERTLAIGSVKIIQPATKATCGRAEFVKASQKITLNDQPKVVQRNQEITGDTLFLFLESSHLTQAVVTGNAQATSDADTLVRGKWVNKLTGRTMTFFFDAASELKKVVVKDQATSVYHIVEKKEYKGSNEVSGDMITVELDAGQTRMVEVKSSPDLSTGKYLPPGK